jgi:type 1 glutamine amidotransferase
MKHTRMPTAKLNSHLSVFSTGFAALILFTVAPTHAAAPKKLLVVTIATGFRHGPAIDAAEKVLPELAEKSVGEFAFEFLSEPGSRPNAGRAPERDKKMTDAEWEEAQSNYRAAAAKAKADESAWTTKVKELFAAKLSLAALRNYDGLIFCNTSGDLPLPDGEGLVNWVKSGKAFIGMHAATDTLKGMPAYYEMINGSFADHLWGDGGTYTFKNHEPSHPTVAMFPAEFQWTDEIYQYTHFNPEAVRVLISLDMAKSKPQAPYHVPVSWVRSVGAGRLFYTNFGHKDSTWHDETYQKHIVAGIRWALKIIDGPAQPNPAVSSQQALKSFAVTAAPLLNKDAAVLEQKALAKAKADPQWALKFAADADVYRTLPTPDEKKGATPEDREEATAKKNDLLTRLASEIEN